jgi:hypothetical protein
MSNIQAQRSERVALRLTPELKAQIEALARADDVTISKWLERAARDAAERKRMAN